MYALQFSLTILNLADIILVTFTMKVTLLANYDYN